MGLFLDGSGIPLAFNLTPGNRNEQITMRPLEQQIIDDFDLSKVVVCTDAGLACKKNKVFNSKGGRAYITTQSLKKVKSYIRDWALDPKGWHLSGETKEIDISQITLEDNKNIYYKERWIIENGIEERLIVTCSPKYCLYQRSIRNNQVQRALHKIENGDKKRKAKNPNDPQRFITETNVTKDGEVATTKILALDESQIEKEAQYDGFYAVTTNLEDPVSSIIEVNNRRWEIEETFRIMKSEFKARPVFLKNDDRIEAHFLTCFLAMTIFRILEQKINASVSAQKLIQTLKDMSVLNLRGTGFVPTFTRTNLTDKLQLVFNIHLDTEIIDREQMKKNKKVSLQQKSTTFRTN